MSTPCSGRECPARSTCPDFVAYNAPTFTLVKHTCVRRVVPIRLERRA